MALYRLFLCSSSGFIIYILTDMMERNVMTLATPSNNHLMRTFKYNGAKFWNALDTSVRGKPSLNSFKGAYLKDCFTHR